MENKKKVNNSNVRNELIGLLGIGVTGYGISLISVASAYIFVGLSFTLLSILASRNS